MRTKKVKPPPKKFEYKLRLAKLHDSFKKKDYISFKFHTTKEFLIFKYILNIETDITDGSIAFNIAGFRAPTGDLSKFGTAEYEYRFYDFKNTDYLVTVHRKNVDRTRFKLTVSRSKSEPLKLSSVQKNSFIEITAE